MSIMSYIRNHRGMALLNMVFIFIFLGVLLVSGLKMYGSLVERGKINDTKNGLENQVKMIVAWSVKNGRLPTTAEYPGVLGGTGPVDAWGKPIIYICDSNLTAISSGGLCGRTSTNLQDTATNLAFVLVSGGDDFNLQTTLVGTIVSAPTAVTVLSTLAGYQTDLYRAVPLEELKSKAGCYGQTGGRLRIVNNELPSVCSGSSTYPAALFADGGVPGYTWALVSSLPSWLILNSTTGVLSPNPSITSVAGTYPVTVSLTDAHPNTVQRTYNLKVVTCGTPPPHPLTIEEEFIMGSTIEFNGGTINGSGATIVLTDELEEDNLNGGANIAVTNAYIDGDVKLEGSQILGNPDNPGIVYINGDLELSGNAKIYAKFIYVTGKIKLEGSTYLGLPDNSTKIYALDDIELKNGDIHGDIYAGKDMYIKDAHLFGNAYVREDLTLNWTPTFESSTRVYYKGSLQKPNNFNAGILAKVIKDTSIPPVAILVSMPSTTIPPLKADSWYTSNGYATSGVLTNNKKIFATGDYTSNASSATNVIIVSKGDIKLTSNNSTISGVLFAPNGKVTFEGDSFTGYVISKDGFYVTRGGSTVTLKSLSTYIPDSANYPFVYP